MGFTTKTFIVFMMAVFLVYYSIPTRHQWKFLLVASYLFYAFSSPIYLLFLAFTTAVTYGGGMALQELHVKEQNVIEKTELLLREERRSIQEKYQAKRKQILSGVIFSLVGLLAVLKYSEFILKNAAAIVGGVIGAEVSVPKLNLILPVGLSFYIFQSLGYCIDVYRGACTAQRNFAKYALFIAFFPHLLQGPIGNYENLSQQLYEPHNFDYRKAVDGIQRVAWGFFKKLVIANRIEEAIGVVFPNYSDYSGLIWVVILLLYTLELYADFSGYMDIAIGSAYMLGIKLDENFDTPLFASSAADFWRRWHITLGAWFRNYLFYPLLRSKRLINLRKKLKQGGKGYLSSALPTVIALAIVWLCTGLWHGADWAYVVWGLYYGTLIALDSLLTPVWAKWRAKYHNLSGSRAFSVFRILRTFAIVVIGFGIFGPADLSATTYIFTHWIGQFHFYELRQLFSSSWALLSTGFGIIGLFCVDVYHLNKSRESLRSRIAKLPPVIRYSIYLAGLFSVALFGSFEQSAFIYFGF